MLISLYTSRVIFQALGNVDYGLNDVVGGILSLFLFVNGSLSGATSRFITYELGCGDNSRVRKIFAAALKIHVLLGLVILFVAEIIGVWMVNNILVIPDDRLFASNVIFQFSIISSLASICLVPFNSLIIANERMSIYAKLGIFDGICRLFIAISVAHSSIDRLILLSGLNLLLGLVDICVYAVYCKLQFRDMISFNMKPEKGAVKSIFSFTFYGLIGDLAYTLKTQGISLLINIFFGPIVNAANAIAYKVNGVISKFLSNFNTAIIPQITKTYAASKMDDMKQLLFQGGKLSFFLMFYLCLPLILDTHCVLSLWLGKVPEWTIQFTRLVLLLTLVESFTHTIGASIRATGDQRYYQLMVSGITLMTFPIAWILYRLGGDPTVALTVSVVLSTITLLGRLYFIKKQLGFSPREYASNVLFRCAVVALLSYLSTNLFVDETVVSLAHLITTVIISTITITLFIFIFGATRKERVALMKNIKQFKDRF